MRSLAGCLAGALVTTALFLAAPAGAAIYWGDSLIGAANADGSGANAKYLQFQNPGGPICDLAVNDTHLYWSAWFGIWRVNLDGPATPVQVLPGMNNPCGMAIDANHVYWVHRPEVNGTGKGIGRATLDGLGRSDTFISGIDGVCDLAVDAEYVYWIGWRGIGRARLDGTDVEPEFIPYFGGGCSLAVNSGYIYWSGEKGKIGRVRADGSDPEPSFISGLGRVSSVTVADGRVYWGDEFEGPSYATIGTATIGGPPVRNLIQTSAFAVRGIAVDRRLTPPPLPLPSRSFTIGKVMTNAREGSATIVLSVPERGDLVVTAPKLGWKVDKGPEPPPWRGGSFWWRLKVWPGQGKGAPNRIRTQLRNKGWARVALRLSYNETGQLPVTQVKRIVLRKHLPTLAR
ncbi:MAG TPA: hypothetical protein VFI03_02605 [Solirubrobacterales bacterium]|nr:hypothetical protein [Solirubrobacterales bacterium]